jgi:cell pole-organizing protein PopZ
MNMTEKNGQPSMEEILASIRRIIAEEPGDHPYNGELRGTPIMLKGDVALEDAGDFDLPAIFRSSPPPQADRQTPLLGRLTDAIRSATSAQAEARSSLNGSEASHTEPVDGGALSADSANNGYPSLSSLKPVRADAHTAAAPMNGASPGFGGAVPAAAASSAFPQQAASNPGSAGEPKRVMAAFKDTHFMNMAAPIASAVESPAPHAEHYVAASAPAAAAPSTESASPVDFGAIVPGQIDRSTLVNGPYGAQPPFAAPDVLPQPAHATSATVIAMPPPPLPAADASQQALVVAQPSAGEGTGTIEDTTADLLRPMLRQWLADNMPRMVEKALHIEIAESVKPPRKP